MSHVRQQIRDAAATLLTGLPTTELRVFKSLIKVLQLKDLPALLVETNDEDIEAESVNENPLLERVLALKISVYAKSNENIQDVLDTSLAEIEPLLANTTLDNLLKVISLKSIKTDVQLGEVQVGKLEINYVATYMTEADSPTTAI